MEHRFPSSVASALAGRSSIRRRSGGLSPRLSQDAAYPGHSTGATPRLPSIDDSDEYPVAPSSASRYASPPTPGQTTQDNNYDTDTDRPTILLVRPTLPSPPLPALPTFGITATLPEVHVSSEASASPLISVPLTPRPSFPERTPSDASQSSQQTRASQIPRLPTPDFTARRPISQTLSFFRSGPDKTQSVSADSVTADHHANARTSIRHAMSASFEFLHSESVRLSLVLKERAAATASHNPLPKFKVPDVSKGLFGGASRPSHARAQTQTSTGSGTSVDSCRSVDTGHSSLVSSVGTTDKFTHKWPRPQSKRAPRFRTSDQLRNRLRMPRETRSLDSAAVAAELEGGAGLNMESIGRWTVHKWCLIISVTSVFVYGIAALTYALLTWYHTWPNADVMCAADNDIIILIALTAALLLLAALTGTTGALLNARPLLAVYTLLLVPALLALLSVGYSAYHRSAFALDKKLNLAWSEYYSPSARLVLQSALACCGFTDPAHEAASSSRCYPRSPLPGCKGALLRFERANLSTVWGSAFSVLPLHLTNIAVALLCSNHVTRQFGKGMMPRAYRLGLEDVRADAHRLLLRFGGNGDIMRMPMPPPTLVGPGGLHIREDKTHVPVPYGAVLPASGRKET